MYLSVAAMYIYLCCSCLPDYNVHLNQYYWIYWDSLFVDAYWAHEAQATRIDSFILTNTL